MARILIVEDSKTGEQYVPFLGRWVPLEAKADFENEFDQPLRIKLNESDFEQLNILRGWKFTRE